MCIRDSVTEMPQANWLVSSLCVKLTFASQVSEALGLLKAVAGSTGHSTLPLGPTPVIVGLPVSTCLMVCEAVSLLPVQSVAVQVRVTAVSYTHLRAHE